MLFSCPSDWTNSRLGFRQTWENTEYDDAASSSQYPSVDTSIINSFLFYFSHNYFSTPYINIQLPFQHESTFGALCKLQSSILVHLFFRVYKNQTYFHPIHPTQSSRWSKQHCDSPHPHLPPLPPPWPSPRVARCTVSPAPWALPASRRSRRRRRRCQRRRPHRGAPRHGTRHGHRVPRWDWGRTPWWDWQPRSKRMGFDRGIQPTNHP